MASILVVDDVDYIREGLTILLTRDGHQVRCVEHGAAALSAYAAARPDLVLLDLGMPILDGWATLPRLRVLDPAARIIIHSGYISPTDRQRALAAGAAGTLVKNLDPDKLRAAVQAALEA